MNKYVKTKQILTETNNNSFFMSPIVIVFDIGR